MRRLLAVLVVALAVAGCKKQEPAQPQQAAATGASTNGTPGAPASAPDVKGTVVERVDAPPYTYLRIKTAQGESWAAVPKTDVKAGTEVTVLAAVPMQNWESKTLNRKWDVVYFGTLAGAPGAQAAAAPRGMGGAAPPPAMGGAPGQGGPPMDMAAAHAAAAAGPSDVGEVKVPKASGADARTVAEIHAQKDRLKEKSVVVRGKVVKFNQGIMGKNWVHLRDGSGTAGKDNDLTVTTNDGAAVGDVVVAKGTVRIDKDFGAGYAYPVIVEDAILSK